VLVAGTAVGVAVGGFNKEIAEHPVADRLTASKQMEKNKVFTNLFSIIFATLSI
jgi:hypothetical protein